MANTVLKFRLKAFGVHLLMSLLIASVSLWVVFFVWHPAPLGDAVGVTHIFVMMMVIDAILGPLLTFVVAKPNKPSLKFDLMVIVLLQMSAYIYGMHSISVNRPVYIAFDVNRFELVQAGDIPTSSLANASPEYNRLGYGRPQWVAVRPHQNPQEQQQRIFDELGEGVAPSMRPDLYEPLDFQWQQIKGQSQALDKLNQYNAPEDVQRILNIYGNQNVDAFLPLKAYEQPMTVLIDKHRHQVVDVVDLRPW